MVVSLNRGTQYRHRHNMILITGIPQNGTPHLGKPYTLFTPVQPYVSPITPFAGTPNFWKALNPNPEALNPNA